MAIAILIAKAILIVGVIVIDIESAIVIVIEGGLKLVLPEKGAIVGVIVVRVIGQVIVYSNRHRVNE